MCISQNYRYFLKNLNQGKQRRNTYLITKCLCFFNVNDFDINVSKPFKIIKSTHKYFKKLIIINQLYFKKHLVY